MSAGPSPRPRPASPVVLTRSSDAGAFLETLLVSAVVAAVGVRAFLALTGYPSVSGGGLHVAHMLWGGLLMLVAIFVLLLFLDRPVQHVAAVVGGLGFGIFIDELGKFLTSDNDYFFRPAVALIYVIFVALFLVMHAVLVRGTPDDRESLANAMDLLEDAAGGTLDPATRAHAVALLARSGDSDLARALRAVLAATPDRAPAFGWLGRLGRRFDAAYDATARNPLFEAVVTGWVVLFAIGSLVASAALVTGSGDSPADPAIVAQTLSTVAGSLLVLRGLPELRRSRLAALRWFQRGVLVWILVSQVFVFYTSQLAGIAGLAADLVAYAVLRYMLVRERARAADADAANAADAAADPGPADADPGPAR